jgi:hypothetical protein
MTLTGRVPGPDGKPVGGASVAVVAWSKRPPERGEQFWAHPDVAASTRAGDDGRFRLTAPRTSSTLFYKVAVVAAGKGHGLGWHYLDLDAARPDVVVRLAREQVRRGRLIDLQGQPGAGVKLHVRSLWPEDRGKQGLPFEEAPANLSPWPAPVITDSTGQFALRGIGPEPQVGLEVRSDRFATQMVYLQPHGKKTPDEVKHPLAPACLLDGTVTRADTGRPVPNARLIVEARQENSPGGRITGRADERGRFRLNPFPGVSYAVTALAPTGEPYLSVRKELDRPSAAVKLTLDIPLPRGVLVHGTVTEAPSGKPVAGAGVQFFPRLKDNPHLDNEVVREWEGGVRSGPDGRFQIAVLPGPGHLLVKGPTPDYIYREINSSKVHYNRPGGLRWYPDGLAELNLKPRAASAEVKVTLRRGVTMQGRLVGADGKPVARAMMTYRQRLTPAEYHYHRAFEVTGGRFELPGCDPEKTYRVFFLDAEHDQGAVAEISARQSHGQPVTVRLAPCGSARARFVDAQGKPVAGHQLPLVLIVTPGVLPSLEALQKGWLYADFQFSGNMSRPLFRELRSDATGRITFPALIPGATYRLTDLKEKPLAEFKAEAGKTVRLGDITVR